MHTDGCSAPVSDMKRRGAGAGADDPVRFVESLIDIVVEYLSRILLAC